MTKHYHSAHKSVNESHIKAPSYISISEWLSILVMYKLFLTSLVTLISFQSLAFTPKEVCLDQNSTFIGWFTDEECLALNGTSPDDLTEQSEKTSPDQERTAGSEEFIIVTL